MAGLRHFLKALVGGFAALVVLGASVSWADPVVYTDRTAWEAAVGGIFQEETFDDATLNPGIGYTSGWLPAEVTGGVFYDRVREDLVAGETTRSYTEWTFDVPIHAFGGNWDMTPFTAGTGITTVPVGQAWSGQIPSSYAGEFFGFVSTEAFTQVQLSEGTLPIQGYETYTLDDLVYSSNTPSTRSVAEPGTVLLLGAGLLGLASRRRHR
ncbi:MAG: PEP-CTERM sorting domain-containing protein [Acidobacteria bacterium]|nr:PEP-CTERM sorting domain-containing protein [Acidobacteriota bacterium]